ncbi:MAG: cell division protein FtsZ, partial [Hyphomicrobiales bacterium]
VAGVTDLMVKEGLINLDFADVRSIMSGMGKAMMGTGEASGEKRATEAAEAAIANPLLDDVSMKGARGLLISITGGEDLTLYEVDEAATRIRAEVDPAANIILGATFDSALEGYIRVSVVATGIDGEFLEPAEDPGFVSLSDIANGGLTPALAPPTPSITSASPAQTPASASLAPASTSPAPAGPTLGIPEALSGLSALAPAPQPEAAQPQATHDYRQAAPEHHQDTRQAAATPDQMPAQPAGYQQGQANAFIPPDAVTPPPAIPRMPTIEELPIVAQREIEAHERGAVDHGVQAQKHKTGFLERLAKVGLGRRETKPVPAEPALQTGAAPNQPQHPLQRVQDSDRIVRPAGPVDAQAVSLGEVDEDQLEIPAFLRRQAR